MSQRTALVAGVLALSLVAAAPNAAKRPVYDESADAKADIAAALSRAAKNNTRVLLVIGGNWCGWCIKLHDHFATSDDVRSLLRAEYEVVSLDIGHGDKNQDVLAKYGIKPQGYPYLAVLSSDDKLVTQQETGSLETGPVHDAAKVIAFLNKWKAESPAADKVVADALAKAKAENKLVFLRFGAPWCGWCHRLDDLLAQPAVDAALSADHVVTKIDIDRMPGGSEVIARYRKSGGGIPWYCILSPDGQPLATSVLDGTNIGYPTEPHEADALVRMFTLRRTRMTDAQLADLKTAIQAAIAQVKSRPAAAAR